ncbi:MAG: DNA alkylation repair protein [Microthrixaceae bacterium]
MPSTSPAEPGITDLRDALEVVADPQAVPQMQRYMKDQFLYLGCTSGVRREAQKDFVVELRAEGPEACLDGADALWAEPEREFQYVGCDLLRKVGPKLGIDSLERLEVLVATKSWWDTVDSLAKVVGSVVTTHPELAPVLDDWVVDDDMWVARAAILHQLSWKDRARPDVVFRYCEAQMDHTDFFVRKAIGWALRDLARSYPEEVWAFVDSHPEMSGLSRREATKHR